MEISWRISIDINIRDVNYHAINFNTFYTGPGATGPAPLLRNIDIRDVNIDGAPSAIVMTGLPEKWLENITLQDITVKNVDEGARITRVKNLRLKNLDISSQQRAMVIDDSYQVFLQNVTLSDNTGNNPLLLQGDYTGAIFTDDFPHDQIKLGEGLSQEIIQKEPAQQVW